MDSKDTIPTTGNSIIKHIFRFDDETKTHLTDLTQYIMLAIIPVALSNKIIKSMFNSEEPISKGSVELLAEIIGQCFLTTFLLYLVNKVIISLPTYTGEPIREINMITIAMVITFSLFALNNNKIGDKFNILYERVKKLWNGGSSEPSTPKKNKVSVSKPISNGRPSSLPTHQESRADYIGTHTQMEPPQVSKRTDGPSEGNNAAGEQFPIMEEPQAFNSLGGFSSW